MLHANFLARFSGWKQSAVFSNEIPSDLRATEGARVRGDSVETGLQTMVLSGIGDLCIKTIEHFDHNVAQVLGRITSKGNAKGAKRRGCMNMTERWRQRLGKRREVTVLMVPMHFRNKDIRPV